MRQVRFSMRSALGSCVLVLLYSFHIWVARGSLRCISSADPVTPTSPSSLQLSKKESRSRPLRAAESDGDRSSLLSMVLADVSEWMADEFAEGMSQYDGGGQRTCRGEED